MKTRQSGFYFVRIKKLIGMEREKPTIGIYDDEEDDWYIIGSDTPKYDSELVILSSRLEEPK